MSWLEQELREQPEALARLLDEQAEEAFAIAEELRPDDVRYVVVAARGSSDNAARYLQYLLGLVAGVPVALATPSLQTVYGVEPRFDGALVVGVSQSGASPDVAAVVEAATRQGRPSVAVTNDPGSPLGRAAGRVLPLCAGEERAVAATKTYLNSLGALALLALGLARDRARLEALRAVPERVAEQIALSFADAGEVARYAGATAAAAVARGVNFATAHEVALKVRELSGMVVEPFSAADLLHGPIAALGDGRPAFVIAPAGPTLEGLRPLLETLAGRGVPTLAISDDAGVLEACDTPLRLVAGLPEWLTPFAAAIPGQVAALRLAEARGLDVDRPAGLSKVTRTR